MSAALPYLDGPTIRSHVSFDDAVLALEQTFAANPEHHERMCLSAAGADLLVMPAQVGSAAGVKMVVVQPANALRGEPVIQGIYVLFDLATGGPVALLDGAALTSLRTPAVSALVTRRLARPDARRALVFGRGPQGHAHVKAMQWALPELRDIVMVGRGEAIPFAADVVCTCTSSASPFVTLSALAPGAHLNVVGSYRPERREVAAEVVAASKIVVDDLVAAMNEAGDLILAVAEGRFAWSSVAGDLVDVARGVVGRGSNDEITLFKSVGLAVQDLAIARLAAERAGFV